MQPDPVGVASFALIVLGLLLDATVNMAWLLPTAVIVTRSWGLRSHGEKDAFPAGLLLELVLPLPLQCTGIGLLGVRPEDVAQA